MVKYKNPSAWINEESCERVGFPLSSIPSKEMDIFWSENIDLISANVVDD